MSKSNTTTETPEQALARIQAMGFGKNDALVIMAFSERGIPAEDIDPRNNVLTFNAWKAKNRRVAKGAISVRATTWIPCKDSKRQTKDGEERNSKLRPKNVFLFHESQTIAKDEPKGTAPPAASNPALVREGTYSNVPAENIERVADTPHAYVKAERPAYREGSHEVNVDAFKDEDNLPQAIADSWQDTCGESFPDETVKTEQFAICTCPAVGLVTNVDCPLHGRARMERASS